MLTPVDIENKEFTKVFRGYETTEVEEFMRTLVIDYEKLYRENNELKEKNAILNDTIGSYKGMEETMQNAILVAQRTAEDIKQNAYERSETIVKDAERRAAEVINNANRSIAQLEKTYLNMQREMNGFKAKMNALLSTYLQLLNELPESSIPQTAPTQSEATAPAPEPTPEPAPVPTPQPEKEAPVDENTNIFSLSSLKEEPVESAAAPVQEPVKQSVGFEPERKLNPVVEEILKRKREEQKLAEQGEQPAAEAKPVEPFSVTKETIEKEPRSTVSSINVEDLKAYDVFSDDTL